MSDSPKVEDLRAELRALQRRVAILTRDDDDAADWFSISETAKRWRVSASSIRRFAAEGRIELHKFSAPNGKNFIAGDVVRRGPPHTKKLERGTALPPRNMR